MDYILKKAEDRYATGRWTAVTVLQDMRDIFFPTLEFLIDLGELQYPSNSTQRNRDDFERTFRANYRLGPHGLQPVIDIFRRLFELVVTQRHRVSPGEFSLQIEMINTYANPLHALLLHFRTTVDRVEYDPFPFAELRRELQTSSNKFVVSSISEP